MANDFAPLNAALILALLMVVVLRIGGRRLMMALTFTVGALWIFLSGAGLWTLSEAVAANPPQATDPGDPCPSGGTPKTFNVSLINIPLFQNRFADVVPEGRMYILDENIAEARATFRDAANPFQPKDIIEPLVLRVNHGDCVEVAFTNRLNEPAPAFNRNDSIFPLPGETLRAPGTVTPAPREFAPARTEPDNDFDPANAPPASMHFDGLDFDVKGSDGTAVGNNPNSTAQPGQTVTYRLFADQEGEFQFKDAADLTSHQGVANERIIGSTGFGAFGGIIVEPENATFADINTGEPLKSGTRAIIEQPGRPDFRENVLFMHDEVEAEPGILTRFCIPPRDDDPPDGNECVNPTNEELAKLQEGTLDGLGGGDADALINGEVPVKLEWFAFNYRSEPGFNREEVDCPALNDANVQFTAPACVGEEVSLSSWPFGDPGGGDLVVHGYRNEPTVQRLFHGAEQETHTFHQHVMRWPFDPEDEGGQDEIFQRDFNTQVSNPLDVQSVSPGAHYSLVMEGGLGSPDANVDGSMGDIIFHCHLYPHFANGMWGLNRSHNALQDGNQILPDGTPVLALQPLDDFPAPPAADPNNNPAFPDFVPGVFGFKGPKPPLGVPSRQEGADFPPTPEEEAVAADDAQVPGAFFVDHCPDNAPLKRFDVTAIELPVQYNPKLKWTDPQQRIYVLNEDLAAVRAGTKKPEPFSPLLNVGDCVEYHLTNGLPDEYGGTVFDRLQETNEVSIHQHMIEFDVLSSDGAANGWNYDQGADSEGVERAEGPDTTIIFRDFVQNAVRTNSFHDHLFPNVHQDAGMFGGSSIHPTGCTFHDPVTGQGVRIGTIVDIRCPGNDDDYRNVSLFIEDEIPMFQPDDPNNPNDQQFIDQFASNLLGFPAVPIFPSKFPSSPDDRGSMGINYSSEPFEARRGSGAFRLFDSKTHGDPATPLPRAFAGDRVHFRLFQLSMEESHGFNLHRLRWKFEPDDPESSLSQSQHIGMLEYFESRVPTEKENPDPKGFEFRDHLYFYGGQDDWFLGAWGLLRTSGCDFNKKQKDLEQLYTAQKIKFPKLQKLPDNPVAQCQQESDPIERDVGTPCPVGAPTKNFNVVAINKDIEFNDMQDADPATFEHDPNGLMYVLENELQSIRDGTRQPEPLILRVNVGDCIEVTLRNDLDPNQTKRHCFEAIEPGQLATTAADTFPECIDEPPQNEVNVPGFQPFPISPRVSLNPQGVNYHIGSDGANVGLNFDTTVGPGNEITYRWFAEEEFGLGMLHDRGDVQNHLHHGLYGGLIVEPAGSTYLDPRTGDPLVSPDGVGLASRQEAVIVDPNGPDFRENVVLENSDLALFRNDGTPVPDNVDLAVGPSQEENDPEDQGEFSINYRNEPWNHRFADNPDVSLIFSSFVHGDPDTPLFRAYPGDNVRFRVGQAVGDPRSTGFALHAHRWRRSPDDPQSQIAAFQGQFNPTQRFNIHLDPAVFGGAGGPNEFPGDYLYRSGTLLRHLPGGQWGIFRVLGALKPDLIPLPDNPAP
jgi:manganese oxidase